MCLKCISARTIVYEFVAHAICHVNFPKMDSSGALQCTLAKSTKLSPLTRWPP